MEDTTDRIDSREVFKRRVFAAHIVQQNELIKNGTINGTEIPLATLGIGNRLSVFSSTLLDNRVDELVQMASWIAFPVGNSYDMSSLPTDEC